MDDGDHNTHEVWYDFLQVHYSYSYEVYPEQDRGVELGFYDCHDAYDMANDMADELCPGVEDTCFDMFISSGFMKCSSCCDFFDECYKDCNGRFGLTYMLENEGYEPTIYEGSGRCW